MLHSSLYDRQSDKTYHFESLIKKQPATELKLENIEIKQQPLEKRLPEPSTTTYLENDLLSSLWKAMRLHPKYSECFLEVHRYLLSGGPLSVSDRHYIAIMASSRHYCAELIGYHQREFRAAGGNEKWISIGIQAASDKMKKLNNVNIILAHRPWRLRKHHIKELTSGKNGDNWSISEVVQAVTLLCHFHALSSFSMGCVTMESVQDCEAEEETNDSNGGTSKQTVPGLVERMKDLTEQREELELSEIIRRYELIETQEKEEEERDNAFQLLLSETKYSGTVAALKKEILQQIDATKYSTDPDYKYVDFVRRDEPNEYPTFRLREFCWPEQGYCILSRLLTEESANLLDKKFTLMMNLTYRYIGKFQCVDTYLFRQAAWNYIQCLVGIRQDDYDYGQVNELLSKPLKNYLKALTCFPEHCNREDYSNIMTDFLRSEKVHLCLIASESRFQNELLYALRAVSNSFKS